MVMILLTLIFLLLWILWVQNAFDAFAYTTYPWKKIERNSISPYLGMNKLEITQLSLLFVIAQIGI